MRMPRLLGPRVNVRCVASLVRATAIADTPENARQFLREQVCEAVGVKLEPRDPDEIRTSRLSLIKMVRDIAGMDLNTAKKKVEEYIDGPESYRFKK